MSEEEKYEKIGGWLIPFAVILVFWVISVSMNSLYLAITYAESINILLLSGQTELISAFEYDFYLALISQFLTLLLAFFFFKKRKGTRAVAIIFFIGAFILVLANAALTSHIRALEIDLLNGRDLVTDLEFVQAVIYFPIFSFILSVISILYFSFSKRVKNTFRKIRMAPKIYIQGAHHGEPSNNLDLFIYAAIFPVLLFIFYQTSKPKLNSLVGSTYMEESTQSSQKNIKHSSAQLEIESLKLELSKQKAINASLADNTAPKHALVDINEPITLPSLIEVFMLSPNSPSEWLMGSMRVSVAGEELKNLRQEGWVPVTWDIRLSKFDGLKKISIRPLCDTVSCEFNFEKSMVGSGIALERLCHAGPGGYRQTAYLFSKGRNSLIVISEEHEGSAGRSNSLELYLTTNIGQRDWCSNARAME